RKYADLVALHLDFKFLLVVLGDLLTRLRRNTHGESVRTQLPRSKAERDFLLESVAVDRDGTGGDEIFTAVEKQRHGFALHTRCLNRQVELEFAPTKGELRRAELGDAHVGEAFGFTDADGEDRHGERRHAFDGPAIAVGNAVAKYHDTRLCRAIARGRLQQFQKPRARILRFQSG